MFDYLLRATYIMCHSGLLSVPRDRPRDAEKSHLLVFINKSTCGYLKITHKTGHSYVSLVLPWSNDQIRLHLECLDCSADPGVISGLNHLLVTAKQHPGAIPVICQCNVCVIMSIIWPG